MAKIQEDDAFFSDDDIENSDEESAGVDEDAGPEINYDALSEDVQFLPCEILERNKSIAQVGPITDEGRENVVELCERALTQSVVERLLYSSMIRYKEEVSLQRRINELQQRIG